MSSNQPEAAPTESANKCSKCQKSPETLKPCAKCHSVWYCNRKCQQDDWKTHRKNCNHLAGARAVAAIPIPTSSTFVDGSVVHGIPELDSAAIENNTFLHSRPHKEVYALLVDVLRMREADTRTFNMKRMRGSLLTGEESSIGAFQLMLDCAKEFFPNFLPPWWDEEKERECIQLHEEALKLPLTKEDIAASWEDESMPMKLRKLFGPLSTVAGMFQETDS